jgi:hypothetical protein
MLASARLALAVRFGSGPFRDRSSRALIVHCCHHKVATVWFGRVLRAVGEEYGLEVFVGRQNQLPRKAGIFIETHSRLEPATLRPFRGSHIVRDPRDVVVSAYFYHRHANEAWLTSPQDDLDGRSYQQLLQSLSKDDGLLEEIRMRSDAVAGMARWRAGDPRILEVRYEDFVADEAGQFRALFRHYGFSERAVERAVKIAAQFGRSQLQARGARRHIRSGMPGDWRNHLTEKHRVAFKERFGDVVSRLGYDSSGGW